MANKKGQTIQWPTKKDRQYNGQQTRTDNTMVNKQGQTIQWSTNKDRQYNGQQARTNNEPQNTTRNTNNLANTNSTKNLTHLKYREITLDRK